MFLLCYSLSRLMLSNMNWRHGMERIHWNQKIWATLWILTTLLAWRSSWMMIRFRVRLCMEAKGTKTTCEFNNVLVCCLSWFIGSLSWFGLMCISSNWCTLLPWQSICSHHLAGCTRRLSNHERGDIWSFASHSDGKDPTLNCSQEGLPFLRNSCFLMRCKFFSSCWPLLNVILPYLVIFN